MRLLSEKMPILALRENAHSFLGFFFFLSEWKGKKGNGSEVLLLLLFWAGRSLDNYCTKETLLLFIVVDKEFRILLTSNLLVPFLGGVQYLPAVVPLRTQFSSTFTIKCRLHLYCIVHRLQMRLR